MVLQTWRDHGRWRVREFLAYQASYYRPYATVQTPRPWDAGDLLAAVGLAGQARTSSQSGMSAAMLASWPWSTWLAGPPAMRSAGA